MNDIKHFHAMFYKKYEKPYQDNFILKFTKICNIKRRRFKNQKYALKQRQGKYFVKNQRKEIVPVCLKTFLGILNISRFRINRITKEFHTHGYIEEKRGGFKKHEEFKAKKESVMTFINSLQCIESHYCRGHSCRKYLSSELNIKKLWKMYSSNENNIPVKESYFRMIFNTQYNLGFGSPRTDVCSTCLQLTEKIKRTNDEKTKQELRAMKRVHKLRASAFTELLQDKNEEKLMLSFDCQKNLPLPKIPDQITYYSHQIYLHNFTVVKGNSKSPLTHENVTAYCWTENQFSKGSNTIASCILDTLNSIDLSKFRTIRLISDGCSGQNKNSILIAMCSMWLMSKAPPHINEIEIDYPVTGHSFLPPDRVFGMIEKKK